MGPEKSFEVFMHIRGGVKVFLPHAIPISTMPSGDKRLLTN